jgi:hypothetical protein
MPFELELPNKGMKLTRPERIGALQLIPGVRPTGLRRQDRLTDDGLPATDCWLEGCETRYRWSEGMSYGPLACRLRTTGLKACNRGRGESVDQELRTAGLSASGSTRVADAKTRGHESPACRFPDLRRRTAFLWRPNKGMKLTKPERKGALQLIPGVRRTMLGTRWPG